MASLKFTTDFARLAWKSGDGSHNGDALWIYDKNSSATMHNWVSIDNTSSEYSDGKIVIDPGSYRLDSPAPRLTNTLLAEIPSTVPTADVKRAELVMFPQYPYPTSPFVLDEFFIRTYIYFPPDWHLAAPINWNWCSFIVLQCDAITPGDNTRKCELKLRTVKKYPPFDPTQDYRFALDGAGNQPIGGSCTVGTLSEDGRYWYAGYPQFSLSSILGRWCKLEAYVKRGSPNNRCIVWLDDAVVIDGTGFTPFSWKRETSDPRGEYEIAIPKEYCEGSETVPKAMWNGEFELYDGLPAGPTYNTLISANMKLIRENTVGINAAMSMFRENQIEISAAMNLQAATPFCSWGTPNEEQWEAFYLSGDVNRDGVIDDTDLNLISEHFGERGQPGWIPEDINSDGMVDVDDLIIVAHNQGANICDFAIDLTPFSAAMTTQAFAQLVSFNAAMKMIRENVVEVNGAMTLEAFVQPKFSPIFDKIIRRLERIQTPNEIRLGGQPEMRLGVGPEIRLGVLTRHFEKVRKAFERKKV